MTFVKEDPTFVFESENNFTLECLQWYNITLPIMLQCYSVGLILGALGLENGHLESWTGLFTWSRSFTRIGV